MAPPSSEPRRGLSNLAGIVVFLVFSGIVIAIAIRLYLAPAAAAAQEADPAARRQLSAISALVLVMLLVSLLVMLVMIFRPGRMLLQRRSGPRTQTKYVDAWAEAGKRAVVDDESEDEEKES